MGDTNAVPTCVWIRAELIAALREATKKPWLPPTINRDDPAYESFTYVKDQWLHDTLHAARAVVDAVETEPPPSMYPYED